MGMGPFFRDIGGRGIALTIVAFTFIAFFNCDKFILEIKLTIICLDLNFNDLIIFSPTFGVTDKNTQSLWSVICWLFFAITILLNLFFRYLEIFLFLGETMIFLNDILDLQIPVITDDAILPVPINPKIITMNNII